MPVDFEGDVAQARRRSVVAAATPTRNRAGFLPGMTVAVFLFTAPAALLAQSAAPPPATPTRHPHHAATPADSSHANQLPPASSTTQAPAPIVRTPAANTGVQVSANPNPSHGASGIYGGKGGEHLGEWMSAHNNLSLDQQQAALDREPGFRDLPAPTQQRIHDRLAQLSAMTPEQRQKLITHNEFMERLQPNQRAEVRSTMLQLSALPQDQRKVVTRAFRDLRGMPPEQRIPVLNQRYRNLNEQQRLTLTQLMHIEPLLPPDEKP